MRLTDAQQTRILADATRCRLTWHTIVSPEEWPVVDDTLYAQNTPFVAIEIEDERNQLARLRCFTVEALGAEFRSEKLSQDRLGSLLQLWLRGRQDRDVITHGITR